LITPCASPSSPRLNANCLRARGSILTNRRAGPCSPLSRVGTSVIH